MGRRPNLRWKARRDMQGRRLIGSAVLLAMASLGGAAALRAQATEADVRTWDIFAGGSFARLESVATSPTTTNNRNATGWEVSVSERPYQQRRWIGGIIEGSGDDSSSTYTSLGVNYAYAQHFYTFMGGPLVMLPRGRVQPFGRVLFGDMFNNVALTGASRRGRPTPEPSLTRRAGARTSWYLRLGECGCRAIMCADEYPMHRATDAPGLGGRSLQVLEKKGRQDQPAAVSSLRSDYLDARASRWFRT